MKCCLWRQGEEIYAETELKMFVDEVHSAIKETFDNRDQEEAIKMEKLKKVKKELITDKEDLQHTSQFEERFGTEELKLCATEWESDLKMTSKNSEGNYILEDEEDPYALALPFRRRDKVMAIIPLENTR